MSGHPVLADLLPDVLRRDPTVARWAAALDDLIDPVVARIDRLDSLLDPHAAPPAMVDWLCVWFGWALPREWPSLERRRMLVAHSGWLRRWRGTAPALRALAEILGGDDLDGVAIEDSGWVVRSGADRPGAIPPRTVRLTIAVAASSEWTSADRARFASVLERDVPAGVALTIEWR
jgi:phage tail-like protein